MRCGIEEFQTLHEIVAKARTNLNQHAWDFVAGGSETETTLRRNRLALDSLAFRPRVLRDVSRVDATTSQFGRTLRLPVVLAPIGRIDTVHPEGAAPVVRAAGEFGVGHMLSSNGQPGLEKVAEACPGALRIFQLYVRGDDGFVDDYVQRACNQGYGAFFLTVDTPLLSRRERDITKRFNPPGRGVAAGREFQAGLDWRTVKRVKDTCRVPVGIKGVATPEDAKIALDHGVDWIYVSNHGGRQLDHGRGTMEFLPEIADAVGGRAKIIVDGGFCRGSDIVKAIAAGADLVGLGRMQCYGLAAGGQAGVVRMLEILEDEVQRCLALLGATSLAELDRSCLAPAIPANQPGVLSAFPLLALEEYRY